MNASHRALTDEPKL